MKSAYRALLPKVYEDLLAHPGRTVLVVLVLAFGLVTAGTMLVSYATVPREIDRNHCESAPAEIMLRYPLHDELDSRQSPARSVRYPWCSSRNGARFSSDAQRPPAARGDSRGCSSPTGLTRPRSTESYSRTARGPKDRESSQSNERRSENWARGSAPRPLSWYRESDSSSSA